MVIKKQKEIDFLKKKLLENEQQNNQTQKITKQSSIIINELEKKISNHD